MLGYMILYRKLRLFMSVRNSLYIHSKQLNLFFIFFSFFPPQKGKTLRIEKETNKNKNFAKMVFSNYLNGIRYMQNEF